MEEKRIRIAILRKMNNLENDDRLRKEFTSLFRLYPGIEAKCFLVIDGEQELESVTSYGLPYKTIKLKSRGKLASGKHLIAKSWDFYCSVRKELKDYDIIWNSGDEPTGVLFFIHNKKIIWDLRELPMFLLGNPLKEILLKYLFYKCDILFHANQFRIDYLKQKGLVKNISKHFVLRNYPDFSVVDSEYDERYNEVKKWIGDRPCVYLQGLNGETRAAFESLTAVLRVPDLCAIVLGPENKQIKDRVIKEFGEKEVKERICYAGTFKVLKVPQYMKLCQLSLVFYKNTSPNNYFCEANRLYQAVDAGLPVVVGSNPSMKGVVEEYGVGVSVDTDGGDVDKIKKGIMSILNKRDYYIENINKLSNEINWKTQEPSLTKAIEKLIYNI